MKNRLYLLVLMLSLVCLAACRQTNSDESNFGSIIAKDTIVQTQIDSTLYFHTNFAQYQDSINGLQVTMSSIRDSLQSMQSSFKAINDSINTSLSLLLDSVQSLQAKIQKLDVENQMNLLEKDFEKYRWDFGQTVENYNDKMSNHITFLSIILAVFALVTAVWGIWYPYTTNKKLEKEIEEVKKQAKNVEGIKEDVEKNANEANATNYFKIGLSKYEEGKPGEALECIEKAISSKKDYPEALHIHGLLKYETKGVNDALTDINDAITLNPYFADAIYIMSLLKFEMENADEAVRNIQYAKKLKKDVIEAYPYRNLLKGRMKALDNAIHYCEYSDDMKTLIKMFSDNIYFKHKPKINDEVLRSLSIEIPNSVTEIENSAFSYSTTLTSIKFPNSLTKIGVGAFDKCSSLTSIEIPESVTEIGKYAFDGCTSLEKYEVSSKNPNYCSMDGALYSKDQTKLIHVPCDLCRDFSFNIKESVTEIEEMAFAHSTKLPWIVIPNGVTKIGTHAFLNCNSLTWIEIPESVTEIGKHAFSGCTSFKKYEVSIKNPIYCSIDGALYSKDQTKLIHVPYGINSFYIIKSVTEIGEYAFSGCTSLTSIKIPESVTEIGGYAFSGCTSLTSIKIPESVTEIGGYAFDGCTSLTSIRFLGNVNQIRYGAFFGCISLKEIYLKQIIPKGSFYAFLDSNGNGLDLSKITLYVPKDLLNIFNNSEFYRKFKVIIGE